MQPNTCQTGLKQLKAKPVTNREMKADILITNSTASYHCELLSAEFAITVIGDLSEESVGGQLDKTSLCFLRILSQLLLEQ